MLKVFEMTVLRKIMD